MGLKFTFNSLSFIVLFMFFSFMGKAQVTINASSGNTGPANYTTLKASFDAINAGVHQGIITVSVTANTTETATATLNASGNGPASYTSVTIKPAASATPTVSGSISSGPVIKLNGANNVTIDGSNNGTTSRDLSITNTSATSSNVMLIGSVGTTPIQQVIVKNCVLTNGTNTATAVLIGDASITGNPGYYNNITLQNNAVRKAYIGIYAYAVMATNNGNNTVITGNTINATGANAIRLVGIYVQGADGATVSNNVIGNFEPTNAEFDRAIWVATGTKNASITGNTISGLAYTGSSSYAPIGLNISSGISNANITVSGNTVSGLTSSGTGNTMGVFAYSAMNTVAIASNKIYNIKNTNTSGYGAAGIVLAATINNAAIKVYNNFIADVAGYGFNGYGIADNGNGIVVDGGGGYNIDFNTVSMTQSSLPALTDGHRSSAMLITANVTAAGAVNIRNNIFANLQTTGNANSRLAFSNVAGNAVVGTMNYNDFYAVSTNLSSTGTNASIANTIAQLQTNLGGNANSVSIAPAFAGTNDLHIPYPGNLALNNLGTPLAGITTDIDGEPRNGATPDMGADEIQCAAPNITLQPVASTRCAGDTALFIVNANNGSSYQWQQNTGSGFADLANNTTYNGATDDTLYIYNVPASLNNSNYKCIVSYAPGCSATTSTAVPLSVNIPVTPAFNTPAPICSGSAAPVLPSTSNNGITGTWNPATVSNTATANYTFTPAAGQCATTATIAVTVNAPVIPVFNPVPAICNGATAPVLPSISTNGITGTWNPATVNNTTTTTYTFTPTAGQCAATATLTVNVNNNTLPTFAPIASICSGGIAPGLPLTSANGITGTWNPASVSNTATTTYTFTPDSGQCAIPATLTITVNPVITPVFNPMPAICSGATSPVLPAASVNGVTGTWSPATVSNITTTTYTFAPTSGVCTTNATLTVTVNPTLMPIFNAAAPICNGATAPLLPATSVNGISGAWSPAVVSNTATGTYTFTPAAGQCAAPASQTVTVNPNVTPVFTAIAPICSGSAVPILPAISNNGITGTWNPAIIDNTATATYTFTPTPGLCAIPTTLTVTVNPNITPVFTPFAPICNGTAAPVLPLTSNNGITGTWNPAIVSNTATGTYTFTPAPGLCAPAVAMTIVVKNVSAHTVSKTICATQVPYTWNGIPNAATGAVYTTTAANGCDSIVTLQLTVLPPAVTVVFDTAACGSLTYKKVTYTNSITLIDTLKNTFGCDSFISVANLVVYPNTPRRTTIDSLGCYKVVFEGNTYTNNTRLVDTFRNVLGCDSMLRTVNITIDNFDLKLSVSPQEPYKGEMIGLVAYSDDNTFSIHSWSPAELFPLQQNATYSVAANADGFIVVEGINEHGCRDTASVTYRVKPLEYGVFIPNAFTPNGDGNNDEFAPRFYMPRAYAIKAMKIFNRYGQTVYSVAGLVNKAAWDGNLSNGSPADIGNYRYYMIVRFTDGTEKEFKGDLTLLK